MSDARCPETDFPAQSRIESLLSLEKYMTVSTVSSGGMPRTTPVFFAHGRSMQGLLTFYWLSTAEATHSQNLLAFNRVSGVIFDSSVPQGTGVGFFFEATARMADYKKVFDGRCTEAEYAARLLCEKGPNLPRDPSKLLRPDCPRRIFMLSVDKAWFNGAEKSGDIWVDATRPFDKRNFDPGLRWQS